MPGLPLPMQVMQATQTKCAMPNLIWRSQKRNWKMIIKNTVFGGFGVFFLLIGIVFVWLGTTKIPDFKSFDDRKVLNSTKIYDRTGDIVLYDLQGSVRRTEIPLANMGDNLKKATIILSTSNVMKDEIKLYTKKEIIVTPFGVNTDVFKPQIIENKPKEYADYLAKQAAERKKKQADELSADLKAVQDKKQQELQKQKDQAQTDLDNEKNKIDFEAENQSVDSLIEQERLNLAGTNQAIADIDRKIAASGFNQTDLDKAQTDKAAIDTLVNDIDERIKANNAMLTNGSAAQQMDAQNKKAVLDQEKQDALKKQQDADQELAKQQSRKTDHDQLVSEKATEENKAENISNKINMLSKYEGKTIRQMKNQIEIDKVKAETEIEGKELKEAKEAEKEHVEKLKELAAKLKKAKDEGDLAEVDALNKKIQKEKANLKEKKEKTEKKQEIYDKKYNFKALEDSAKDAQKSYVKSQEARLDPLKTLIQEFDVKIKEMNNIHVDQQHDLMSTLSQNYENANRRSGVVSGLSKITGVFSVGRAGGSNFQEGRANNNAANYARDRARGKK
jgi:hypothetical protein